MLKACLASVLTLQLAMAASPWSAASGTGAPLPTLAGLPAPSFAETAPASDRRVFSDPPLLMREYGFGVVGGMVAGALGFYIGSGLETAFYGEKNAHQGTLSFTGIRYDNFYGAFWGGSTGLLFGSALTTYFVGQTDEEDGGFFWTLAGTGLATGAALYAASLAGVNDDIGWVPFIPLLALPSAGGVLGFNISRWFSDRKRESVVGPDASIHLHAPRLAWGRAAGRFGGDRLELQALKLTF